MAGGIKHLLEPCRRALPAGAVLQILTQILCPPRTAKIAGTRPQPRGIPHAPDFQNVEKHVPQTSREDAAGGGAY